MMLINLVVAVLAMRECVRQRWTREDGGDSEKEGLELR